MKAIIPLAGYGTRMRPLTHSRPKPLLNVAGKPMLGHVLDKLLPLNVEELIIIRGYLGDQIESYVSSHYPQFPVVHYVDQTELKGQAHALWLAREYISGPVFSTFVDTIFETDLSIIQKTDADGIAFVKEVADPRRFGIAITNARKQVQRLVEKPDSMQHRLALIGTYFIRDGDALNAAIAELLASGRQTKGEYYLVDALQIMINRGAKFLAEEVGVWEDCGKPEEFLSTNAHLLAHGAASVSPNALVNSTVHPAAYIAPGARVEHSVIGPDVSIAAGAILRHSSVRNSIIDENALIEFASLEGCMIGQRSHVRHFTGRLYLGDDNMVRGD